MKITFYGRLAESLGRELQLEVAEGCSVAELRTRLSADHPSAADVLERRSRACVADAIVDDTFVLQPTDEVEFFPPVSGG